ncbi:MAG TPA: carnitine dehydratase [Gammaproteobacteria bacterium]|jgi:formyl-CoA transferase|nr:carnitine dehydratase [Gammaproteobacteria bacterium]HAB77359.1 carnitine dehydratase [Gammaproteobacteria bacterium]HBZ90835.1 carnitine dehydratase [Gammaproteobacteria bacterium]
MTSLNSGPLEGIRVIELGSLIAGPYAGALFAQFGADVIKIEPPAIGDPLRKWRKMDGDTSLWWYSQSRNKQSLTLNLKDPDAQEVLKRLVSDADVLIENFRPGTLEKWNLGWDALSKVNPRLVMLRVSGYGQSGPQAGKPGFAAIAEAIGGLRYLIGYPDRAPVRTGVSIGDTLASLYGVVGSLMALRHAEATGEGQVVDVSLVESVLAVTESLIPEYGADGTIRERTGSSLPGIAPSNTYTTRDGRYLVLAANGDSIFNRLMQAIGRPDIADDPQFKHNDGRAKASDELDAILGAWSSSVTLTEALDILEAAEVPASGINSVAEVFEDEQIQARGSIERHALESGLNLCMPAAVPKLTKTPGGTRWLGPKLGEHNESILESLGLDPITIRKVTGGD